ncbi:MAG: hypothetical protein K6T66_06495 [Peptococcaceae bacterium]|nr:hypothetical protein [Peptococcaceae bacterium]
MFVHGTILGQLILLRDELVGQSSIMAPWLPFAGDGADGDFSPSTNQTLDKYLYRFDNLTIPAGVTVTSLKSGLIILARNITISGLLSMSGKGAPGGAAVTASTGGVSGNAGSNGSFCAGGAGGGGGGSGDGAYGGKGGDTDVSGGSRGTPGVYVTTYAGNGGVGASNNTATLWQLVRTDLVNIIGAGGGSGAACARNGIGISGAGGAGGGALVIECINLTINSGGAIRSDGIAGQNVQQGDASGGGGGGGGGIIIVYRSLANNGTISSTGGAGGYASPYYGRASGGAGGNGAIILCKKGV